MVPNKKIHATRNRIDIFLLNFVRFLVFWPEASLRGSLETIDRMSVKRDISAFTLLMHDSKILCL